MFLKPKPMNDRAALGIGDLIAALLIAVVGLALVPTIQSSSNSSRDAVGATSAAGQLVTLLPMFYVIVIVAGVIAFVVFKHRGN